MAKPSKQRGRDEDDRALDRNNKKAKSADERISGLGKLIGSKAPKPKK